MYSLPFTLFPYAAHEIHIEANIRNVFESSRVFHRLLSSVSKDKSAMSLQALIHDIMFTYSSLVDSLRTWSGQAGSSQKCRDFPINFHGEMW